MARRMIVVAAISIWAFAGATAAACSLCSGGANRASLREDFASAKLVLYGALANPRINADGAGSTELQIETVLKNDPALANRKTLNIARYVPVDPKSPPKFLVFCDIFNGQIDPYRGSPVKSACHYWVLTRRVVFAGRSH